MLALIPWAGTTIMAFAYIQAATPRELAQYRKELELDRERRNRNIDARSIKPLAGSAGQSQR